MEGNVGNSSRESKIAAIDDYERHVYKVERTNLLSVITLAVKTLIQYSAERGCIDDDSVDVMDHFCCCFEGILIHGLQSKGLSAASLFSSSSNTNVRSWWQFIRRVCMSAVWVPELLSNIDNMNSMVRTDIGRGRIWIRLALMQKRLADFVSLIIDNSDLVQQYYKPYAFMQSEDLSVLQGLLHSLNAVNFSLCLKGTIVDVGPLIAVDYSRYLVKEVVDTAIVEPPILGEIKGSRKGEVSGTEAASSAMHLARAREQAAYNEELLRGHEKKIEELTIRVRMLTMELDSTKTRLRVCEDVHQKETSELQSVILELQEQLRCAQNPTSTELRQRKMSYKSTTRHNWQTYVDSIDDEGTL